MQGCFAPFHLLVKATCIQGNWKKKDISKNCLLRQYTPFTSNLQNSNMPLKLCQFQSKRLTQFIEYKTR